MTILAMLIDFGMLAADILHGLKNSRRLKAIGLIGLLCLSSAQAFSESIKRVPRTVIALYDSKFQEELRYLKLHQLAEMPLNHLGLILYFHDIQTGLPDIKNSPDVRGVLTWFPSSIKIQDPKAYIEWAIEAIEAGKKFVVLGNPGFLESENRQTPKSLTNRFWEKLGLYEPDQYVNQTYLVEIAYADPLMVNFERDYKGILPPFPVMEIASASVRSHLTMQLKNRPGQIAQLITSHPNGGDAAADYAAYKVFHPETGEEVRQWYLNPFNFFRLTFDTDKLPKFDTTTLAGRRIYYSHIDGDGWNSITELEKYKDKQVTAAEVILKDFIEINPEWPVTVGPIAADIDLNWFGTEKSRDIARSFFKIPYIEVGCHTFTHPFDWLFFTNYQPEMEAPYLHLYSGGGWRHQGFRDVVREAFSALSTSSSYGMEIQSGTDEGDIHHESGKLMMGYSKPRAYALQPFDLNLEIFGAIKDINELTENRRRVKVYLWSGNCLPFAKAIAFTRDAGVRNINGGDTRFDFDYYSYGWVAPIGRQVGNQRQIYASNSNENTYTDMWSGRYYSFNQLTATFKNTETPIRIKPMNLYYHMYSGEKLPSLNALLDNMDYIKTQPCLPTTASQFSRIGDSFYQAQINETGPDRWQIINRGALQTIRFDQSLLAGVDFERSQGVIGQVHLNGSLYVYLDESVRDPLIQLKLITHYFEEPPELLPYLIQSRWSISQLERQSPKRFTFQTHGFGFGEMVWSVPQDGIYLVSIFKKDDRQQLEFTSHGHQLKIQIPQIAHDGLIIQIDKQ